MFLFVTKENFSLNALVLEKNSKIVFFIILEAQGRKIYGQ